MPFDWARWPFDGCIGAQVVFVCVRVLFIFFSFVVRSSLSHLCAISVCSSELLSLINTRCFDFLVSIFVLNF